jgi:hypothetical protein
MEETRPFRSAERIYGVSGYFNAEKLKIVREY